MRPLELSKKASRSDWHPADIIAAVRKRGSTLRQLSISLGYHPGVLKHAIARPYPKAEAQIAAFIGVRPAAIWPSRYLPDGTPDRNRQRKGTGRYVNRARVQAAHAAGNGRAKADR